MRRPAGEVMAPHGSWERGEEEAEWRAVDSCLFRGTKNCRFLEAITSIEDAR